VNSPTLLAVFFKKLSGIMEFMTMFNIGNRSLLGCSHRIYYWIGIHFVITSCRIGAVSWMPSMVEGISLIRNYGLITARLLGRIGSGIGAECRFDGVTEQIDAMEFPAH
jgi:ABC-type transporter Mla maintaining outer membrane lipid asymmetry permease subunit MlaE